MVGLPPVHESECGQVPIQLLRCIEGRWWTSHHPHWAFVSVSFAGVVLLSINNHWSRSCSYWPYNRVVLTVGCSWSVLVLGKLLLKELWSVMIREGEGHVSWETGTAGLLSAMGVTIRALRCWERLLRAFCGFPGYPFGQGASGLPSWPSLAQKLWSCQTNTVESVTGNKSLQSGVP